MADIIDPIQLQQLIGQSKKLVIGTSGGVDSMVLLHWLSHNQQILADKELIAMHVDHQISPNSILWGNHVKHWCAVWNVPCVIKQISLNGLGNNIELAARHARYAAFDTVDADAIILAHHADDQIETVLMKLFRGSGLKGLKGMQEIAPCWFNKSVTVLRPLLHCNKQDIKKYAYDNNIAHIEDDSNQNIQYDRNWIRKMLWPTIKSRYDTADLAIAHSIKFIDEGYQLSPELAEIDYQNCIDCNNDIMWLAVQRLSVLRIKNLIMYILSNENITTYSVRQIESFANGLKTANMNSSNEFRLSNFVMCKRGKKITWQHQLLNNQ